MEKLTKKQRKELKKLEEQQELDKQKKSKKIKTSGIILGIIVFILLGYWLITFAKDQNQTKIPPVSSKDVLIGQKDNKVQLTEYADFECPSCAEYSDTIERLLTNKKISFVYRFFPLTSIHKNAKVSAQAAYASYKQGKFLQMYKLLYKNQASWSNLDNPDDIFTSYAKKIGLNIEQFKKDYQSKEVKQFVADSESQALSLGIYSTPTFFINGNLVDAKTPADLEQLIKREL